MLLNCCPVILSALEKSEILLRFQHMLNHVSCGIVISIDWAVTVGDYTMSNIESK